MNSLFLPMILMQVLCSNTLCSQTNWNGSAGTDWNNAGNWSAGIPDAADDVTIGDVANDPTINVAGALAKSVVVQSGGVLTISSPGTLSINNNNSASIVNSGTVQNTGTISGTFGSVTGLPSNWTLVYTATTVKLLSSGPLPIELTFFKAKILAEKTARLDWQTASERDNLGFEIQRSPDGLDWQPLSFLKGNSTTTELSDYSFLMMKNRSTAPIFTACASLILMKMKAFPLSNGLILNQKRTFSASHPIPWPQANRSFFQ